MIKTLLIICCAIIILLVLPKLIKILGIKNEKEIKQSISELASYEINELKDSLGITKKYQKLANSIIKEAEDKLGVNFSQFETKIKFDEPNIKDFKTSRTVLTDDDNHPFQITKELANLTDKITIGCISESDKLIKIYNWFVNNIIYGTQKRDINNGYRTSNEVFKDKEGICGEMASLFVVMSRYIGINCNYVSVRKDYYNENVYHACAGVKLNGKTILIDPAYNKYDAKHKEFIVKTDTEAIKHLNQWRNK